MIPYGQHQLNQDDIDQVIAVLKSEHLTQGPLVPAFEADIANYCAVEHAVAVNNATSALHLACLALGLGADDEVWTSPQTFVASANCARHCGAAIDFVDIDPATFNLSVDELQAKLERRIRQGKPLPKLVIAVHMCGQPCDMAGIAALAQRYGFKVIEDGSHALGSSYRQQRTGSCQYSDITVFSFHPVKIITSAEGGMATCNDARLAKQMQTLRYHGITRDCADMTAPPPGDWHYEQQLLGFNFRLSEIQAALGRSQFKKLDIFVQKRHKLAQRYDQALSQFPVLTPVRQADAYSSFHLYIILLEAATADSQQQTLAALRAAGIGVTLHYSPVHLQPYYRALGFNPGDFPTAENYAERAITLPLYPGMSESQQDRVINTLRSCLDSCMA